MNYCLLGMRIKDSRNGRHITQKEMARALHFSPQHLGNVERGTARPSVDMLVDISNKLDVSMDYLLQDSLAGSYDDQKIRLLLEVEQYLNRQKSDMTELQRFIKKSL